MASATEILYRTDVFAPQDVITATATAQWTDVFARCERRATPATTPTLRRLPVRLSVNGTSIEFTYITFEAGLPGWADSVLGSLAERWGTRAGWNSYGALPTNQQLVVKLLNILSDLLRDESRPPIITPLADGGVQAEWHHSNQDLEIVVPADEEPNYYYLSHSNNVEEEADLHQNYAHVQDLIEQLT
jgi:hypothetical protein